MGEIKIVAFTGLPRSGKTFYSKLLSECFYRGTGFLNYCKTFDDLCLYTNIRKYETSKVYSFATILKEQCAELLDCSIDIFGDNKDEWAYIIAKNEFARIRDIPKELFGITPRLNQISALTIRELLNYISTFYKTIKGGDYYAKTLINKIIKDYGIDSKIAIIDDCRFIQEFRYVSKYMNGKIYKIKYNPEETNSFLEYDIPYADKYITREIEFDKNNIELIKETIKSIYNELI
jgi:tRNA uridine 5-carbamoylmethylation protein Kti12